MSTVEHRWRATIAGDFTANETSEWAQAALAGEEWIDEPTFRGLMFLSDLTVGEHDFGRDDDASAERLRLDRWVVLCASYRRDRVAWTRDESARRLEAFARQFGEARGRVAARPFVSDGSLSALDVDDIFRQMRDGGSVKLRETTSSSPRTPVELATSPVRVRHVFETLQELADADFQSRLWRAQIPGLQGSWLEACEVLWDDSGLADALDAGAVFTPAIDDRLRNLYALMEPTPAYPDVEELLTSARMRDVRTLASELIPLVEPIARS